MSELREVFEMTVKQMGEPDLDSWREQEKRQRRASRNRKFGAITVAAVVVIAGVILGTSALRTDDGRAVDVGSNPTGSPLPTVTDGPLEPGRYVISTLDPNFNASHRITIDVPEGYSGLAGVAVLKDGLEETGVGVWQVGYIFADACAWRGTHSIALSTDDVVETLVRQEALRPTLTTDVTLAGVAGTYMELTLPAGTELGRCHGEQFRLWSDGEGGTRYLDNPGQTELLWILDVDGAQLVIDAPLSADASSQDRAEVRQMVESIRIQPREDGEQ